MNRAIKCLVKSIVAAVLICSLCVLSNISVNAATGPGNYSGGSCSSASPACYHGAAWVKYKVVDESKDLILPNVKSWWDKNRLVNVKKNCKDYDYVYVLVRFETSSGTGNFTGYAATSTQVKHVRWQSSKNKKGEYIKNKYIFWNSSVSDTSPYISDFEGFKDSKEHDWSDPLRAKHDGDPISPATAYKAYTKVINDPDAVGTDSNGKKIKWNGPNSTIGWFCYEKKATPGEFSSISKVKSPIDTSYSEKDGGGTEKPTNGKASAGTYKVEGTDPTTTVTVKFYHRIRVTPTANYSLFKSANPSTKWTIKQKIDGKNEKTKDSGTFKVSDLSDTSEAGIHYKAVSSSETVTVKRGKKVKVCQIISYNHKNFAVDKSTKKLVGSPSGENDSEACITISYNCPPDGSCDIIPESCPLPGFDHTIDYGNTVAETVVKNFNNSDWATTVLAKPGDEIQFRHTLCAGAQTVTTSNTNGATRETGHVTPNWFYLRANADSKTADNYLFNRGHLSSGALPGGKVTFDKVSGNPSQLSRTVKPEETYTGNTYFYGFRLYSPRLASTGGATSYDNNPYNCILYDGSLAETYQISGFGSKFDPNCASAKIYTSGDSTLQEISRSNVGHAISQSLVYNDVKAWVNQERVEPHCGCTADDSSNNRSGYSIYKSYPGGNGYLRQSCNYVGGCSSYHSCSYVKSYDPETGDPIYGDCSWTTYGSQHTLGDRITYYPISVTSPQTEKTATVKVPYNFTTSTEATIERDPDIVYAGQKAYASYEVNIYERQNSDVDGSEAYMTMTPNDTRVELMSFTINSNIPASSAESYTRTAGVSNPGENIQNYLGRTIGSYNGVSNFQIMNPERGKRAINERGELHGEDNSGVAGDYYDNGKGNGYEYGIDVPDVEVGSKFCVVVGISHADSHDIFATDEVTVGQGANSTSMNNASSRWRISNASCRTIAKKPSFQAWGGMYTQGKVITSVSEKHTYGGGDHIFGSWTDTLAIGAGSLYQFASGAVTGYSPNGGGAASGTSYCDMIKMTISNANKTLCDNNVSGQAGIFSEISNKLEQILSRYTPSSATNHPSGYEVGSDAARNEADELKNGGRYTYVNGDTYVNTPLIQTSGTRVIHLKKSLSGRSTLHINQNICTGAGACQGTDNRLALNERNSTRYTGIEQIPQVIIIVENGDVEIDANVTQIDAWIFAPNGNINTCTAGHGDANTCAKTLIFNGPVFAKTLTLNRTAGAYPGYNANGYASANRDLASSNRGLNNSNEPLYDANHNSYGSATAGEIFNLRPDAYFWAYNQANHLSQATVVYMRELAPRY